MHKILSLAAGAMCLAQTAQAQDATSKDVAFLQALSLAPLEYALSDSVIQVASAVNENKPQTIVSGTFLDVNKDGKIDAADILQEARIYNKQGNAAVITRNADGAYVIGLFKKLADTKSDQLDAYNKTPLHDQNEALKAGASLVVMAPKR